MATVPFSRFVHVLKKLIRQTVRLEQDCCSDFWYFGHYLKIVCIPTYTVLNIHTGGNWMRHWVAGRVILRVFVAFVCLLFFPFSHPNPPKSILFCFEPSNLASNDRTRFFPPCNFPNIFWHEKAFISFEWHYAKWAQDGLFCLPCMLKYHFDQISWQFEVSSSRVWGSFSKTVLSFVVVQKHYLELVVTDEA